MTAVGSGIEFWFEFASTYSYVGAMRIEQECARAGVALRWRPFLLGPLFTEQLGIQDSPFNVHPVRGRRGSGARPRVLAGSQGSAARQHRAGPRVGDLRRAELPGRIGAVLRAGPDRGRDRLGYFFTRSEMSEPGSGASASR